ncbi:MAG: putative Ntn-hydrolase superfamily protein, partial [Cyclobacteriaceae bacterium]
MKIVVSVLLLLISLHGMGQYNKDNPLVHTYSIVAYDPETGDIGVAVQSHWFSVGTVVTWAEPGVGAVATQSFSNPAFGPQGLALMKSGLSAEQALKAMLLADDGRDFRQVGIIDINGNAANHTGQKNIEAAGGIVGENYAVQANMMENDQVWSAMSRAFESAVGSLAERMLLSLEAAQAVGGDIRGKQSAAILVVSGVSTGKIWKDTKVDIRVDDHADPLVELRRLLKVHQAYEFMNAGDIAVEAGDFQKASDLYSTAEAMFPENLEMKYWHAVNLANTDQLDQALPMFKEV